MVCDEVIVLYHGRIVERGAPATLFSQAAHPYTRALLRAVPRLTPGVPRPRAPLPVAAVARPSADKGCAFAARCALAHARCLGERPLLREWAAGHAAACHVAEAVATAPDGRELAALAQNV